MTREICQACGRISAVGFSVPDAVWIAVMGEKQLVLCLACFTARADDSGVRWEDGIEFWPVSLRSHLDQQDA